LVPGRPALLEGADSRLADPLPIPTPQWRIRTTSNIIMTMVTRIMRTGMALDMATIIATAATATQATIICTA
jgi:hypothetical protein